MYRVTIQKIDHMSEENWDVNCYSLSTRGVIEGPFRNIQCLIKASVIFSVLVVRKGTAFVNIENWSATTYKAVFCLYESMKSRKMLIIKYTSDSVVE